MGLHIFIITVAIIIVTLILLVTLVSPDNWGVCCQNCAQGCCNSSGLSSESCESRNISSSESVGGGKGNKQAKMKSTETAIRTEKGTRHVLLINKDGEIDNDTTIINSLLQKKRRLTQTPDLYATLDLPLWKQYWKAKKEAEQTIYVPQMTYLISPFKAKNIRNWFVAQGWKD